MNCDSYILLGFLYLLPYLENIFLQVTQKMLKDDSDTNIIKIQKLCIQVS